MARASLLGVLGAALGVACIGVQTRPLQSMLEEQEQASRDAPFQESLDPSQPPGRGALRIDPEQRFQRLEGFGAAVAWHLDRLVGRTSEGLYEFLFPELGLDILRLRNRFERGDPSDRNLEQEAEIVERATRALGHPPKIMMSSWSPPGLLKANGEERCRSNGDCTLLREGRSYAYARFADYWRRSLLHYATLGIRPDFVSIQNEPDFIPPDWEGCKFEPRESQAYPGYGEALRAVHAGLATLPAPPRLLGPEVLGVHYAKVQRYLEGMDASLVHGIAHHLYEKGNDGVWDWRDPGPNSFVDEMAGVARAARGKPLFQTEFNTDEDRGKDGGFETAWLVHHSLVAEGASAFLYWDLIWTGQKGLVGMQGRTPEPRDHYYAVRHYARYTDPGDVRVAVASDAEELVASAFLSADGRRLTLVALNTGAQAMDAQIAPGSFSASVTEVYRTSFRPGRSRSWEALGPLGARGNVRLPARAVATVVYRR